MKKKRRVWGRSAPQFSNLIYSTGAYQAFVNILLKIHYSFPIKYWLLLSLFLPRFHYSFTIRYWLLSCPFLQTFLFWCLWPKYSKYLTIEEREKKRVSEGELPPQKLKKKNQFSKFNFSNLVCIPFRWHTQMGNFKSGFKYRGESFQYPDKAKRAERLTVGVPGARLRAPLGSRGQRSRKF